MPIFIDAMVSVDLLLQAQKDEESERIVRRLGILIQLQKNASEFNCDIRTVSLWNERLPQDTDNIDDIRRALSDKPRSGRPPKVDGKLLEEAKSWYKNRVFTVPELQEHLESISGVSLSQSQIRRYIRKWGYAAKKYPKPGLDRLPGT